MLGLARERGGVRIWPEWDVLGRAAEHVPKARQGGSAGPSAGRRHGVQCAEMERRPAGGGVKRRSDGEGDGVEQGSHV